MDEGVRRKNKVLNRKFKFNVIRSTDYSDAIISVYGAKREHVNNVNW